MDNKLLKWLLGLIISMVVIMGVEVGILISNTVDKKDNYSLMIHRENIELMYEGARADLVQCIDSTMRVYAPTTCMNGLEILRQCEKYNVDIFFVLAQGHIESHFGTKGLALRTNSVFNVFAFDGQDYNQISAKGKYSHPDLSIEPYLKLLTTRYLVNGKSEIDMMNKYIDVNGKRYATSKEYELNLTNMYQRYTTNDTLMEAYKQYIKYKILAGK